jgi:Uma2 family endonuclease
MPSVRPNVGCSPRRFAVQHDVFNELQPDVLVARYVDLTLKNLPAAPVLAVEVVSSGSRLKDANLKKAAYARSGTRYFWLVDPDLEVPTITAWELVGGSDYQRVTHVAADEVFQTQRPFPVKFSPSDLIAGLRP